MNHHRMITAAVLAALLAGCSTTPDPTETPTPPATTRASHPVSPPASVEESGPAEGWIGDDELHATHSPVDVHPDEPPEDAELAAAVTAATEFILGWLTPDQGLRRQRLEGVAAEALIAAFDDPRFTPVAVTQHGPVHVIEADPMQITTRHRLNTGTVVDVTLILDPDATLGWIAITITT